MQDYRVLETRLESLNDKFKLAMEEAEKRNGQRFEAQQEAVATAMVAQEKAVIAAMAAAEKAVAKAEVAAEKRFESVNEFRQTLTDQTNSFITRHEYAAQHQAIVDKAVTLEQQIVEIRGKSEGKSDLWGVITGVVAMVISIATFGLILLTRHGTT
jgi:hypothetical protein